MYSINTSYFKTIVTEEQAYVLAWFWSRGSGHVQVSKRDLDVLFLIKNAIKYTGEIHHYTRSELNITNKDFRRNLLAAGCVKNNHCIPHFPIIPPELNRHFIRGIYDSYGTIRLCKGKYINVSITYDEECVSTIRKHLLTMDISTKHYYRYTHTNTVQMMITRTGDAKKFLDWIYQDANYYLTRKFIEYQEMLKKSV